MDQATNPEALAIFEALNDRIIAFNPAYAKITGSLTAGILLSQLIYWARTKNYGEFYKTDKELKEETGMGKYELISAKKAVEKFFSIKRRGVPAKTYYQIKIDVILANLASCGKTRQLDGGKPDNKLRRNQTTITENTAQITTDTNTAASPPAEAVCNEEMQELVDAFKPVNPTGYLKFFKNTTQRAALVRLAQHMGVKELKRKIEFLTKHNEETGTWKIFSPTQLEERLSAMESFWTERKNKLSAKPRLSAGRSPEGIAVVKTADGWQTREIGEAYIGDVISEEEYQQRRNALKTAAIAACGKCSSGWLTTATGERLCSCIENL